MRLSSLLESWRGREVTVIRLYTLFIFKKVIVDPSTRLTFNRIFFYSLFYYLYSEAILPGLSLVFFYLDNGRSWNHSSSRGGKDEGPPLWFRFHARSAAASALYLFFGVLSALFSLSFDAYINENANNQIQACACSRKGLLSWADFIFSVCFLSCCSNEKSTLQGGGTGRRLTVVARISFLVFFSSS